MMPGKKNGASSDFGYKIAILRLLATAPQTLGSLSAQLGLPIEKTHEHLREIHNAERVEADGMREFAFTVFYENPDEDADEVLYFDDGSQVPPPEFFVNVDSNANVPEALLTMRELILVALMIDDVLELVPPGADRETLKQLHKSFEQAARERGFAHLIERSDDDVIAYSLLSTLENAIRTGSICSIAYSGFDETEVRESVTVFRRYLPDLLVGGPRPTLFGLQEADGSDKLEDGIARRLRLDRIGAVDIAGTAGKRARQRARRQELDSRRETDDWRRQGREATLHLAPQARWIAEELHETPWREGDGELVGTIRFRNYGFLARVALQAGEYLLDVEPADVRAELNRIFATLEKEYA